MEWIREFFGSLSMKDIAVLIMKAAQTYILTFVAKRLIINRIRNHMAILWKGRARPEKPQIERTKEMATVSSRFVPIPPGLFIDVVTGLRTSVLYHDLTVAATHKCEACGVPVSPTSSCIKAKECNCGGSEAPTAPTYASNREIDQRKVDEYADRMKDDRMTPAERQANFDDMIRRMRDQVRSAPAGNGLGTDRFRQEVMERDIEIEKLRQKLLSGPAILPVIKNAGKACGNAAVKSAKFTGRNTWGATKWTGRTIRRLAKPTAIACLWAAMLANIYWQEHRTLPSDEALTPQVEQAPANWPWKGITAGGLTALVATWALVSTRKRA